MNTVQTLINAKRTLELAEQAYESAKAQFEAQVAETGEKSVTVDGMTVALVSAERRAFDTAELAKHITASTYEAVTKVSVDPKAFDKARKSGDITEATEQSVVTITRYNQVRVTEAKTATVAQVA
jgi:coenzyme F420-reducing hydrogenase alpha subunit